MAEVRVILQARLNSTRLPGKCLLPVSGYPLFVLAAKRAGNTGLPVVVATSSQAGDDPIATMAAKYGLNVYRGPLDDVHARFIGATLDLGENDWIVRLTADNLFPDGQFIEHLLKSAKSSGGSYMGTHSPFDGLPYGLSAEVFTVQALRAVQDQLDNLDREHVTPAIKRRFGANQFVPVIGESFNHLRCTVDNFADYQRANHVFSQVKDPIQEGSIELCRKLASLGDSQTFRIPFFEKDGKVVAKLTLGTAQLGLPMYGRTNSAGRPHLAGASEIIRIAVQHGVTHIDSARAYGEAEERVGMALQENGLDPLVITKLAPLEDISNSASSAEINASVEASVFRSLHALRRRRLDVLMLHRWSHHGMFNGRIWDALLGLRSEGLISDLGASVYDPVEAMAALADPDIKHLQIPFNLLDNHWSEGDFREARARRPDVLVYGRSAFLQGVLLSPAEKWPSKDGFSAEALCAVLDRLVSELGRKSRADLCVAFVASSPEIDTIVMGVETLDQLMANLRLMEVSPLSGDERQYVSKMLPSFGKWLLNPSQWPV